MRRNYLFCRTPILTVGVVSTEAMSVTSVGKATEAFDVTRPVTPAGNGRSPAKNTDQGTCPRSERDAPRPHLQPEADSRTL